MVILDAALKNEDFFFSFASILMFDLVI